MQTKFKLLTFLLLSVYPCTLLAQGSDSSTNSDDRNILTEIYDGSYTVSNEAFNAKLVGVYMDDCPELYRNSIIRNYYTVDQFRVVHQVPFEVYWAPYETDKNKDWKKENVFIHQGTEAPSWFTFEFLRGKLLTIKAATTRDYLFTGFSKHDKGKLGAQGMNLILTSDDEKQFIIETLLGKDDEVYLVLTPSLMESLGMGSLTSDYAGKTEYKSQYNDSWYAYTGSSFEDERDKRFIRSMTYWSIIINKTKRSTDYVKVPTALVFKLELVE